MQQPGINSSFPDWCGQETTNVRGTTNVDLVELKTIQCCCGENRSAI